MATGAEFRQARLDRGIPYRHAATVLGVSLSTVQRWEQADTVSDDAVATLRDWGPENGTLSHVGYQIGRLMRIAESMSLHPEINPGLTTVGSPLERVGKATAILHLPKNAEARERWDDTITEIMRLIPQQLPEAMLNEMEGSYWIGYYHQRADMRDS